MKRLIIWIICVCVFMQSSMGIYAAEYDVFQKQNSGNNYEFCENEKDFQQENEDGQNENQPQGNEDGQNENQSQGNEGSQNENQPQEEEGGQNENQFQGEKTSQNRNQVQEEIEKQKKDQDQQEKECQNKGPVKGAEESQNEDQVQGDKESQKEDQDQEKEESQEHYDDPLYGRANGIFDVSFYDIQMASEDITYIHNSNFSNHIVKDIIDVSYYQGDIDWEKVKKSGIDYAIIRVGYRGYGNQGSLNCDKKFYENIEQARSAGIKVGVYFFSQAISEKEAIEEAEYVVDLIKYYKIDLPVVLDFEYASFDSRLIGRLYEANLSKEEATKICDSFCNTIQNNGYIPMIYANKQMLERSLNAPELAEKYKIWLANFECSSSYEGMYDFWQYTPNGIIDGITGYVDKSFWYKEINTIYEGVDYSLVYDFKYYVEHNQDVKELYGDDDILTLKHFVTVGMKEGRQGCESFSAQTYRNRYVDLRRGYGKNWKSYYQHYIKAGVKEKRSGSGNSEIMNPITVYNGVDYSLVYDFEYYVARYPDIKELYGDDDILALKHFATVGMKEGRQGCESFSAQIYRNRYADLRRGYGKNWESYYQHYMKAGVKEKRSGSGDLEIANPITVYNGVDYLLVYDFEYYVNHYPDIKELYGDDDILALKHFVTVGMKEGRQGCESFSAQTYRNRYVDLRRGYGKNWASYYQHYMKAGAKEKRSGSGNSEIMNPVTVYNGVDYSLVYDFKYYVEHNQDVKELYGDDDILTLKHFVTVGMKEGHQGTPSFNVFAYKSRYADLRKGYGNNWKNYYQHYMKAGIKENRSGYCVGEIISCEITAGSKAEMAVRLKIKFNDTIEISNMYYLVEVASDGSSFRELLRAESVGLGSSTVDMDIVISGKEAINEAIMDSFAIAIKDDAGVFFSASECMRISNPEALAENTTAVYQGTSKKGLQGITFTSLADTAGGKILDARNANTKHTLLNLDLATIVSPVPKAGFEAYTYKGNTYYFDELVSLRQSIESLNAGYKQYLYGNSDTTKVAVSVCLLLSYNPEMSYLIDPAARTPGHSYYMLNVREEKARETFEALFLYLGEAFGKGDQNTANSCYVSNWILGNEINSSKAWNYSGSLDFDTYMECYATAFRLLYNGVKSTKTGNTVSISLDNGWTAAPDTYAGKTTLDTFAKKIHAQNPNIKWSIAYHPYSYPLTRVDFWNDYSNTTDSLSTRYISMRNIKVLTNYAATLESNYGLPSGSIRVLLTEQGYSYSGGDQNQAMAIVRGYYIAEFNDRIDAFIIRSVIDDPDEAQAKLYFGLMNRKQEKRIAFFVYEHMDSDIDQFKNISPYGYVTEDNYDKFNKAKTIVCDTNWGSYVPGFNKTKLAAIK